MDAAEPQLDLYQIMRASGQIEALLGIAAHTQFDNPSKPIPPTQEQFLL